MTAPILLTPLLLSALGLLLAAGQALDFHLPLRSSAPLEAARAVLREQVPTLEDDRHFAPDIEAAASIVTSGALSQAVAAVTLPKVKDGRYLVRVAVGYRSTGGLSLDDYAMEYYERHGTTVRGMERFVVDLWPAR